MGTGRVETSRRSLSRQNLGSSKPMVRFRLTSRDSVGADPPGASSSPRLPPDSEFYSPALGLYNPDTVEEKRKEEVETP